MDAIAYKAESAFSGIEVLKIEYGVDDYIFASYVVGEKKTRTRKSKIRHDGKGRAYFIFRGNKQYIDDFVKV